MARRRVSPFQLSIAAFLTILSICLAWPVVAVEPNEVLKDATLEARARKISAELRCLVCQNQSIDDSNAPLAHDLRMIVRERLQAGDQDFEVKKFIVDRYGEFVLLRPRFGVHTLLLWLAPGLIIACAVAFLWRNFARRTAAARTPAAALSPAEEARLAELLSREEH
jgi:cytochrome c-type biogenesis protein CcmH